jgi:hypothetical protein
MSVECIDFFAGKPAPTGFVSNVKFVNDINLWERGLPAVASGQSIEMSNVPASSRASPLPQVSLVATSFAFTEDQNCRSEPAREKPKGASGQGATLKIRIGSARRADQTAGNVIVDHA